jgi:hypothetical protein
MERSSARTTPPVGIRHQYNFAVARRFRQKPGNRFLRLRHVNGEYHKPLILKLSKHRVNRRRVPPAVRTPSRPKLDKDDLSLKRIAAEVFAIKRLGIEFHS